VPNKPKENASFPLIQQLMVTVENPQRQIAVTLLPKTVLCGDTNGKPNLWGVIVSSDDQTAGTGNTLTSINMIKMCYILCLLWVRVRGMVFNATFYNISIISWRSVLLLQKTGAP
jgi:hypothetical protein